MTRSLAPLTPNEAETRVRQGHALLIDIRDDDEFARRHIPGAISLPLARYDLRHLPQAVGMELIFTCRSGMRTTANADKLAAPVAGPAYVLDGGVDAWAKAGLPVQANRKAPLEIIRQVQIIAGSLVLIGVALGFLVSPGFFFLSAAIGAGLTFAGVTGFCGMAKALAFLPWNRPAAA